MSFVVVIFGITGDLSRKKLIPALYRLIAERGIRDFSVVGVSRHPYGRKQFDLSKKHVKQVDEKSWNELFARIRHFSADVTAKGQLEGLHKFIGDIERESNHEGNRLFYLATSPSFFPIIVEQIKVQKLAESAGWSRIVFEKPFGSDGKSAANLNKIVKEVFAEDQIYRIDHYLGKELIQNMVVMRFTNQIFEPIWNSKYVDHVQIVFTEQYGVEERGSFYDQYGAIKDVMQNHMLQMLALTAMEKPRSLGEKDIRNDKVKVLGRVSGKDAVVGQYVGYAAEKGVSKGSRTETLAAVKCMIDTPRWKGVPFYLLTGKRMKFRRSHIYIQFKELPCLFMDKNLCMNLIPNHFTIMIEPEDGFHLVLNGKVPGSSNVTPIKLDFCYECLFGPNTPEAYENLLHDVIKGDQSAFIRADEIAASWAVIDKLKKGKVNAYDPESLPKEVRELIENDNRRWYGVEE